MMIVAQRSNTTSLEQQRWIGSDIVADPATRERTEDMAVGDDEHVVGLLDRALGSADGVGVEALADFGDEFVETVGDLLGGSIRLTLSQPSLFFSSPKTPQIAYSPFSASFVYHITRGERIIK